MQCSPAGYGMGSFALSFPLPTIEQPASLQGEIARQPVLRQGQGYREAASASRRPLTRRRSVQQQESRRGRLRRDKGMAQGKDQFGNNATATANSSSQQWRCKGNGQQRL